MKPSDRKIRDVTDVNEIENGSSSECNLSITGLYLWDDTCLGKMWFLKTYLSSYTCTILDFMI